MKIRVNETFSRPFFTGYMENFSACELSLGNRSTISFYGKFHSACGDLLMAHVVGVRCLIQL